jgi:predicted patatin/cPLA2 family phospholipase
MDLTGTALILEGGGLRGNYTAGVLRFFTDKGLFFPYVIGVSIGACNGSNYVSRQPERNRIVNTRYVRDPRFLSYRRLLAGGGLFGMAFVFGTIPLQLVPFDFERFFASDQRHITTATDCVTGQPCYYEKDHLAPPDFLRVLQAGCSLPLLQKPVRFDGRVLMDGGLADPIPLRKSMADGNTRHVLILTQPRGDRKKASPLAGLIRLRYGHFPGLHRAFADRHRRYNETVQCIDDLERKKTVFTIRPAASLAVSRAERNKDKLYAIYDQGYHDAAAHHASLTAYLERGREGDGKENHLAQGRSA